jgi:glycerol-3-phosphate acyltransferase PlsY
VLELFLKTLLAYLLGSVVGALVMGKLRGGVDIRALGSGNAGGTNALRTQGKGFAFWVFAIDIAKGWIATALLPTLVLPGLSSLDSPDLLMQAVVCGAAVVLGHIYPVWFGFRGGKGAATLIGVVLGIKPMAVVVVLIVWLAVVMASGFVGLATIIATASFDCYLLLCGNHSTVLLLFGALMTLLIIFTHRSNIARMRAGTENRSNRLWLLRPR